MRVTCVALTVVICACAGAGDLHYGAVGGLQILEPADGAVLPDTEVRVAGVTGADAVTVNGTLVPVSEGRFEIELVLAEGTHPIEAVAGRRRRAIEVRVDLTPPVVTVESPAPGSFVDGEELIVSGTVTDRSSVELFAGPEPVTLDASGRFAHALRVAPGAHRVALRAVDAAGHEGFGHAAAVTGRFAPLDEPVVDAAALTAGRDVFDEIGRGASILLSRTDLAAGIRHTSAGDLEIGDVWWGPVTVTIEPADGALHGHALVPSLWVDLSYDLPWPLGRANGHMASELVELNAWVAAAAVDGRPLASVTGADVALHGFSYDISGVPGFIEGLIRGEVRGLAERQLSSAVQRMLSDYVEDALSGLPLRGPIDVLGAPVILDGSLTELTLDPAGLHAAADLGFAADAMWIEGDGVEAGLYPVVAPRGPLPPRRAAGLGLDVAIDAINAMSTAVWRGMPPMSIRSIPFGAEGEPLLFRDLAALLPSLRGDAPAESLVGVVLDPRLPPVVTPGVDGSLRVQAADVTVAIVAHAPLMGEESEGIPLATLSIGIEAGILLSPEDGALAVDVSGVAVTGDVVEGPGGFPRGERLAGLLDSLLPALLEAIDLGALPLPGLLGFQIVADRIAVDGGYLSFDGTLRFVE